MALTIPTNAACRSGLHGSLHLRLSPVGLADSDNLEESGEVLEPDRPRDEPTPADDAGAGIAGSDCHTDAGAAADAGQSLQDELGSSRSENAALRARVLRLEEVLNEHDQQANASWAEREKEYESLLEEKSEVIRSLHLKMQEGQSGTAAEVPREEELLALSDELERERAQLKEDEETLMKQMREMEVQMSHDRADIARQRTELQRLQNEIQHELEMAARDQTLRDRLAPLQRKQQDLANRRGTAPATGLTDEDTPAVARRAATPPGKKGGLLRRIFG